MKANSSILSPLRPRDSLELGPVALPEHRNVMRTRYNVHATGLGWETRVVRKAPGVSSRLLCPQVEYMVTLDGAAKESISKAVTSVNNLVNSIFGGGKNK